ATSARALPVIERNTKLLAQLIDDLLDVSGIIACKLRHELGPVDLVAVIESSIEAVQGLADAKSIGLNAVLDPSAGSVAGDPGRLQQVVWNLLANAIKFTPNRGRIDLRLERAGAHARLTVRDTGRGISPELLRHIFDRFRQDERTRQHGGLGLGLAMVGQIVKLHEGNVGAESEGAGRGATWVGEIGMPGDDGYVLIRKVRALGAGEGGQVRALALTAYARSEDRALALEAGFHTHIAKPVDPLELTALIAGLAPERRD